LLMQNRYSTKLTLAISLVFTLLFLFNVYYFLIRRGVGPTFYISKITSEPSDPILELPIYQDLVEEYRILNRRYKEKSYIVFVGDSITKRFNINEFFEKDNIINRGIFSDTTLGLIKRLEKNINNLKIDKLFIMIGYNDLKYRDNNSIINNIEEIVRSSSAKTIYVQSILPVDLNNQELNLRINLINNSLSDSAIKNNYIFINLNDKFKDENGSLDPKLSIDGTHPNFHGYTLWFSIVKEYI